MEQPFIDIMQSLSLSSDPQITSPFVVDVATAVVEIVVVIVVVLSATVVVSVEDVRRAVVGVTSVGVVIPDDLVVESICFSVKTVVLSPAQGGIVDVTFSSESDIDVVSRTVVSAVVVDKIFVLGFVVSTVVDDSRVDILSIKVIVVISSLEVTSSVVKAFSVVISAVDGISALVRPAVDVSPAMVVVSKLF